MNKSSSTQGLLSKVLGSIFYKVALKKAPKVAKNADSILKLLQKTLVKSQSMGVGGIYDEIRRKVTLLGSLLKAYAKGDYREIELFSIVKIVAGLLYFLSPIDFIPDFLPIIGLTDDIALLAFIIKGVSDELDRFETWKNTRLS